MLANWAFLMSLIHFFRKYYLNVQHLPTPRFTNCCPRSCYPILYITWYTLPSINNLPNLRFGKIVENVHCTIFSFRKKKMAMGQVTCTAKNCVCTQMRCVYLQLWLSFKGNDEVKTMNIKMPKMTIKLINVTNSHQ